MNPDQIAKLEDVIEKFGVSKELLLDSAKLQFDFGFDSLDMVEVIMSLEDAFGINISDDEIGEMGSDITYGDLKDFLSKRVTV
jgi:acyl carrier protein